MLKTAIITVVAVFLVSCHSGEMAENKESKIASLPIETNENSYSKDFENRYADSQAKLSVLASVQNERYDSLFPFMTRGEYTLMTLAPDHDFQNGEGYIHAVSDRKICLTYSKLGNPVAYFGQNNDRYWLIHSTHEGQYGLLVNSVIRFSDLDIDDLPPYKPEDFTYLLGVFTINAPDSLSWSYYDDIEADMMTIVAVKDGFRIFVYFNRDSRLPQKVSIYKVELNQKIAESKLDSYIPKLDYESRIIENSLMPSKVVINIFGDAESVLKFEFIDYRNGPYGGGEISESMFDFDSLLKSMGVSSDEIFNIGFD